MNAGWSLWARDLLAYSFQLGLVVATGLALSGLLRLRAPRVKLAFAQGLLALALVLPWIQPWRSASEEPARVAVTAGASEATRSAAIDATSAVGALLVLGGLVRLALLGRRLGRLRRYRRLSRSLEHSPAVTDAWVRVGLQARVCLSDEIEVPAAFGVLRPVVLVPAHFASLAEAAQRAVLCHELLHVRRHDWLQMLIEEVAGAVLWFHPAVWWLLARIRLAREQVVDQEAVRLTRERRVYLETLVGLARVAAAPPAAAPLFLTESHLKGRVDVLLREVTMSKSRVMAGLAVSVAGVALAGVAAAWAFPLEAPARAEHGPAGGVAGVTSEGGAAAKKTAERKVVQKPNPAYPTDAKKKGVEGSVVLDVLITAAGDVKDVKVVKGPAELTESAMTAVRQWKYEAGPDDTRATLTVRYMLDKKKEGAPRP